MANESLGNYFWRGGKKIELQKTEDSFTTIIGKNSDLDRVKEIPGVSSVKKLYGNITELKIDPKERDNLMDKIRSDEVGLICHHEYVSKESPTTKFTLTDEIIVKFKPEVSSSEILKIVEDIGVMIKKQYSDEPNSYLLKVTSKANANPIKVANKLVESNKVEYAEANLINVFQPYYKPRDSLFKDQWHLSYVWGIDIAENADIMASEAWEITKGSREIAVAILDDGVDLDHPDFKGEGKIMFPKDFVDGDIRPFPEKEYGDYHGTACAGVAVAEENGIGTVGGAHRCALMPVRFALSSTDNQLIEIFDYISQRANVLSCSWGPAPVNAPLNTKVYNKIHQITTTGGKNKKGLVIIFAAGNYNAPLNLVFNSFIWYDWNSKVPKKVTIGKICNGFAVHPDVIAVSACTSLNKKAAYSNWGKEISVTAPSNNFHPYDFSPLPGRGITTTDNEVHGYGFKEGSEYTSVFGGTSSATPLLASVAALVLSVNPDLTAKEVKEILETTADKIVDESADIVLGMKKGTYDANGHSEWFGYGKVNAFKAVFLALKRKEKWVSKVIHKTTPVLSLKIPDNDPVGVQSALAISEIGMIEDIKVSVDITHSYIGDLVVTLISPSGEKIVLHDREGTRTHDIKKTFDIYNTHELRSLLAKEEITGTWILDVKDNAWRDEGTLNLWSLELKIAGKGDKEFRIDVSPKEPVIPDHDPKGLTSVLKIERTGKIADIKPFVEITHTYIGDLTVTLISPSKKEILLHNRSGGWRDNIMETYDMRSIPDLKDLVGDEIEGEWKLKVVDHAWRDVGKLNKWGLEIRLE